MNRKNIDWFMEAIRASDPKNVKVKAVMTKHRAIADAEGERDYIERLQKHIKGMDMELSIRASQVETLQAKCDVLTERLAKTNEAIGRMLAKAAVHSGHLRAKD